MTSLLRQLISQGGVLPDDLETTYEESKRDSKRPSFKTLLDCFIKYSARFSKVFVLLDALDECAESEIGNIQELIQELRRSRLLIFVTARLHGENLQTGLRIDHLDINDSYEIRAADSDIRKYVIQRLKKNAKQKPEGHWIHTCAKHIEDRVVASARWM